MGNIAFVGGQLCPETMPVDGFIAASKSVLKREGTRLISYPFQVNMHQSLIEISAKRYEKREGKPLPLHELMITTGSKQAIWDLIQCFSKPGDIILSEELTYVGSIQLFKIYDREIIGIPMDEYGMRVDVLEQKIGELKKQGKEVSLIYTIPSHHNPTGVIMPLDRRQKLIELAIRHEIPVIEDDCYGDVIFDKEPIPPSLHSLTESPLFFYLGSYSKILGPGLRLGYFAARKPYFEKLNTVKNLSDGGTSALSSLIVSEYLKEHLWEHMAAGNALIKKKQDVVCDMLTETLQGYEVSWTQPRGGIFLWIKLPGTVDLSKLESLAKENEVEYTPGRDFSVDNSNIPFIRLSYAHLPIETINEGIRRLSKCIINCIG